MQNAPKSVFQATRDRLVRVAAHVVRSLQAAGAPAGEVESPCQASTGDGPAAQSIEAKATARPAVSLASMRICGKPGTAANSNQSPSHVRSGPTGPAARGVARQV